MEAPSTTEPDTGSLTADAVRGRATGALFFLGFGAVWAFVGLKQTHHATRTALLTLALLSAMLLALIVHLMRRAHDLPLANISRAEELRTQRLFNAVNIIQWVSVGTAILILNVLQQTVFIVPAIAMIVGLHLFPLAGAFRYRQHYVTGSLLVLWSLGCMVLLPQARLSGVCAGGVAAVLLLSAAATLLRCYAALRTGAPTAAAVA